MEDEIQSLAEKGIIEKVDGPTPWVSPLVVTPKKNGDVRICVDMRMANRAISRERHPMPTVDDLIHRLNGATVFSKLDLLSGYHQLTLAKKKPLHHHIRHQQRPLEIHFSQFRNQFRNISDDVIVFGKTQAEHDAALKAVCQNFAAVNLTLNKRKCEFNKSSVIFFGFAFSGKGMLQTPRRLLLSKRLHLQPTLVVFEVS